MIIKVTQNNLYNTIQNVAVSTIALQSFILGYHEVAKNKKSKTIYPKLEYLFFVLPIVYHENSMNTFKSSQFLHTALMNNKSIILGLQDRALKMSKQTFDCINLGLCKKIIYLNIDEVTVGLMPGFDKRKLPLATSANYTDNSVKKIQTAAYKLGNLFAKTNDKNLQISLNIRF